MNIDLNPKVNFTPVTHNFNDYTIISHVIRPIALLVTGFVIAIFAGIAFALVQSIVWGTTSVRRTLSFRVNEGELKRQPLGYLMELSDAIVESNRRLDVQVNFLNNKMSPVPSRGVGLQRHFFTVLFEGLKILWSTTKDSGFHLYKTGTTEFLIPQSEPMAPGGETSSIYYKIGAVMTYVFFNAENFLIGQVFQPSIFSAILSLTDEEIDLPYAQLTDAVKLKMLQELITAQINAGDSLRHLLATLPFLQKKGKATDGEIANLTYLYGSAFSIVDEDDITKHKFLLVDNRAKKTGQESSYAPPDYMLDISEIRKNMDEFHQICLNRLLNTVVDSLGTLRLTLYPIHTMAKAMKTLSGRRWSEIRFPSDPSTPSTSSSTSHSIAAISHRLNCKIQGELNREVLISKVVVHSESPIIICQWEWMKEWIRDENTSINQIQGLLIFWTGSPSIDWEKTKKLNISERVAVGPDLASAACFQYLYLPSLYYDLGNPQMPEDTNRTKEGFFKILNQVSKDRSWTNT